MRDFLSRLRAALSPQAIAALALAMLLLALGMGAMRGDGGHTALERRVSKTLSSVKGAGQVQVVIKMKETAAGFGSSQTASSVPCGAVAVAQGADDPLVQLRLQEALCALLGLPASAVSVVTGGS